jgi:glycosyltransferase involved in cell wall biosynthesis
MLEMIMASTFLKKVFNKLYQINTQQIVLASSFKNDLQKIGRSNAPIIVTTTAIDKSDIVIEKRKIGEKLNVLFLGRIQNLKGVEEIIDAIIQLRENDELKYFHFTFVGHEDKNGYINSLKSKLALYQINDSQVAFPGRITGKEKFRVYASHDIYLLPSYTEGCPNSVLEALASGLFCITTGVGALSDIIENKSNGILIEVKSSKEIVSALLFCKNNKSVLNNRSENTKKYSQKFDIKKIVSDFNNVYLQLIHE